MLDCFESCRGGPVRRSILTLLLSWAVLPGCAKSSDLRESKPCISDTDCTATETCVRMNSPGERPAILPSCPYLPCVTSADCSEGSVCGVARDGWRSGACSVGVCIPPCTVAPCAADEICRASGLCELAACDEAGAPACAEHWHCDPAAAPAEPTSTIYSSTETDTPQRAVARGCVRTRCEQAGGFVCDADWVCDPEHASEGTGCVGIPCAELGHCTSDDFICAPTSTGKRPSVTDHSGCVQKNCEEGHACNYSYNALNLAYCDAASPLGDEYGCRVHTCAELSDVCSAGYRCDRGAAATGELGCVPDSGSGGAGAGGVAGVSAGNGAGAVSRGVCVTRE
jgi:hypothetical protein